MTRRLLYSALALPFLLPGEALAQSTERYTLRGDRVAVYDLVGRVRVEGAEGAGDVVVEVTRAGEDRGRLRVETQSVRGREALIVRFPADRVVYREAGWRGTTDVRVRSDGTFFDGNSRGGERVRIASSGSGLEASADLTVQVPAGRSVDVYLGVGRVHVQNVQGNILVDVASAAVTAEAVRGNLDIDTGSGSVRARDIVGDKLRIDTGSGSVDVSNVRASHVDIDTGSGGVDGNRVQARSLIVDTGSGHITMALVEAVDVKLDTGSGGVRLDLVSSSVERVRIDTGSGAVRLAVPQSVNAVLDVDTGSGGIDVDIPVRVRRSERGHFTGTIGDGRGRIEIDTGSGGVRITGR